jgi:glutathione S-transferase
MSTRYEVIYFGVHGRAEPIRLLLTLAGADWKGVDVGREQWGARKAEMPLGQMPVLVEHDAQGTRMIPQSQAILRHLARTFGLAGRTEEETLAADLAAETALDAGSGYGPLLYGPGRGDAAAWAKHFGEVWPVHGKRLATLLARAPSSSGFFAGPSPTWGDIVAFHVLHATTSLWPTSLDAFPTLQAFVERMAALPQWRDYLATRPVHEGVAARPA